MKRAPIILPIINVKDLLGTLRARTMEQALEELKELKIPVHGTKKRFYVYWSDFNSAELESNEGYKGRSKAAQSLVA